MGLVCSVLVAGCGSGDGETPVTSETGRVLSGTASKGPLTGATIRVYDIDARGQRQGPVLAQTTTDSAGNWTLSLAGAVGNLLIESSGGLYVDEADPEPDPGQRRTIQLAADNSFSALVPADATSAAINVYTDALLRKSRHETQGANFFDVYQLNRSFFNAAFGFDITSIQPADPVAPDDAASLQEKLYAMALGGAANAINALAIANQLPVANYQIISGFIDDLSDCVIDGQGVSGPVQGIATLTVSLNAEILRFRNNNFHAYQGTPLLVLDQSQCARSGQLADTIAPDFLGWPGDFVVESADDQGVASDIQRIQRRLQEIEAVDDRDGTVDVLDDLADFLPIGSNVVTYTAFDLSANRRTVTLTITVVLPQAPTIIAPADIIARATGDITQVNLGTPEVSDNASGLDYLIVENNAPGTGFARGQYHITWTVTDEAGFSAQAVQQLNVGTVPGFAEVPVTPGGFGELPVLLDPDEIPLLPIPMQNKPKLQLH